MIYLYRNGLISKETSSYCYRESVKNSFYVSQKPYEIILLNYKMDNRINLFAIEIV